MSDGRYVTVAPEPAVLVESLREIGYTIETAVADIVDNSITARASTVWIQSAWNAGDPHVAIVDDGHGMTEDKLLNAMRFGSSDPRVDRPVEDLGRFGLGLKTASLSQCRNLVVLSRSGGVMSCCEWDLDRMNQEKSESWRLRVLSGREIQEIAPLSECVKELLGDRNSGTVVLWRRIDRIDEQAPPKRREAAFNSLMAEIRAHLELIFHLFLTPPPGIKRLRIMMNGAELKSFNPFNLSNNATQELPQQTIQMDGQKILVHPYVLPHHSKVAREEYERYAGPGGYLNGQGFYVYRNRRLIIRGTWFRLIAKTELTKLIRIRVEIPNSLDHLWGIDVKKSKASPPERVREELRTIIGKIELRGKAVYKQRGTRLTSRTTMPLWTRTAAKKKIIYEVNREHPLHASLEQSLDERGRSLFRDFIKSLESSLPIETLYSDIAGAPADTGPPELGEDDLGKILASVRSVFFPGQQKLTRLEIEALLGTEPFSRYQELTRSLIERSAEGDE